MIKYIIKIFLSLFVCIIFLLRFQAQPSNNELEGSNKTLLSKNKKLAIDLKLLANQYEKQKYLIEKEIDSIAKLIENIENEIRSVRKKQIDLKQKIFQKNITLNQINAYKALINQTILEATPTGVKKLQLFYSKMTSSNSIPKDSKLIITKTNCYYYLENASKSNFSGFNEVIIDQKNLDYLNDLKQNKKLMVVVSDNIHFLGKITNLNNEYFSLNKDLLLIDKNLETLEAKKSVLVHSVDIIYNNLHDRNKVFNERYSYLEDKISFNEKEIVNNKKQIDLNKKNATDRLKIKQNIKKYPTVNVNGVMLHKYNIRESKFKNGDIIQEAKTYDEWLSLIKQKKPAYKKFVDDKVDKKSKGYIYNIYAYLDERDIAPLGFHRINILERDKLIGYKISNSKKKYQDCVMCTNGYFYPTIRCPQCSGGTQRYIDQCHGCRGRAYVTSKTPKKCEYRCEVYSSTSKSGSGKEYEVCCVNGKENYYESPREGLFCFINANTIKGRKYEFSPWHYSEVSSLSIDGFGIIYLDSQEPQKYPTKSKYSSSMQDGGFYAVVCRNQESKNQKIASNDNQKSERILLETSSVLSNPKLWSGEVFVQFVVNESGSIISTELLDDPKNTIDLSLEDKIFIEKECQRALKFSEGKSVDRFTKKILFKNPYKTEINYSKSKFLYHNSITGKANYMHKSLSRLVANWKKVNVSDFYKFYNETGKEILNKLRDTEFDMLFDENNELKMIGADVDLYCGYDKNYRGYLYYHGGSSLRGLIIRKNKTEYKTNYSYEFIYPSGENEKGNLEKISDLSFSSNCCYKGILNFSFDGWSCDTKDNPIDNFYVRIGDETFRPIGWEDEITGYYWNRDEHEKLNKIYRKLNSSKPNKIINNITTYKNISKEKSLTFKNSHLLGKKIDQYLLQDKIDDAIDLYDKYIDEFRKYLTDEKYSKIQNKATLITKYIDLSLNELIDLIKKYSMKQQSLFSENGTYKITSSTKNGIVLQDLNSFNKTMIDPLTYKKQLSNFEFNCSFEKIFDYSMEKEIISIDLPNEYNDKINYYRYGKLIFLYAQNSKGKETIICTPQQDLSDEAIIQKFKKKYDKLTKIENYNINESNNGKNGKLNFEKISKVEGIVLEKILVKSDKEIKIKFLM